MIGQDLQQFLTSDAEQITLSFYAKVVGSSTDIVVELEDADNSRHVAKLFTLTTSWARLKLFLLMVMMIMPVLFL